MEEKKKNPEATETKEDATAKDGGKLTEDDMEDVSGGAYIGSGIAHKSSTTTRTPKKV